jgi:hypothetical protein
LSSASLSYAGSGSCLTRGFGCFVRGNNWRLDPGRQA